MSNPIEPQSPVKRSKEEIDNEYTRCATLLGDKQFRIKFLYAEVDLLFERMTQLNQELMKNHLETVQPPEEKKVDDTKVV